MPKRKCKRCGACCHFTPCQMYTDIFGEFEGWSGCPLIRGDKTKRCGLLEMSKGELQKALMVRIGVGKGCCAPSEKDRLEMLRIQRFIREQGT